MAPASAAVLLPAAAAALMAMALLLSAAAAATAPPPALIGQPGCNTTCGNVSVPYPFGFGAPHCYWPGLNLTCDTSRSHQPPRLLFGDGSLRVDEISLYNHTVRVMRSGSIINTTDDFTSDGWNASLAFIGGFSREDGYLVSNDENMLVAYGCNVVATISTDHSDVVGDETTKTVSSCASLCDRVEDVIHQYDDCTGTSGCCQAYLNSVGVPDHTVNVSSKMEYTSTSQVALQWEGSHCGADSCACKRVRRA